MGDILKIIGGSRPFSSYTPSIIKKEEVVRIVLQLNDIERNEKSAKRALQFLCEKLEAGGELLPDYRHSIFSRIDDILERSRSDDIRRWIYKVISLTKAYRYKNYLKTNLRAESETCQDNMVWLIAALFSISEEEEALSAIKESGIDFHGTHLEHASRLFSNARITFTKPPALIAKMGERDVEVAKLICFLFAYGRDAALQDHSGLDLQDYLSGLSTHDDPLVAEYVAWSLLRADMGSINDIAYGFGSFKSKPGNVRRWLYMLAGKNKRDIKKYRDVFEEALAWEEDESAREGLISSIISVYDPTNSGYIAQTFIREGNFQIKIKLLEHMASHVSKDENYYNVISEYVRSWSGSHELEHNILKNTLTSAGGARKTTSILRSLQKMETSQSKDMKRSYRMSNEQKPQAINITNNYGAQYGTGASGTFNFDFSGTKPHTAHQGVELIEDLRNVLTEIRASLASIQTQASAPPQAREAATTALVQLDDMAGEAATPPSPGWVKRTVNVVGAAAKALPSAESSATTLLRLMDTLGKIADKL